MTQMVVRFDTAQMESLVRFVRQEMAKLAGPSGPPPELEPIVIQSPEGERVLFVDEIGESHWVSSGGGSQRAAKARGWRLAWARKAEQ